MKKTFLDKQTKLHSTKVLEDELSNFSSNPRLVKTEYLKDITIFSKGGVQTTKKQYLLTFKVYSTITYDELVNGMVREKYSDSEEFAILRKAINNPTLEEYVAYNTYVEDCKTKAKAFVAERESI